MSARFPTDKARLTAVGVAIVLGFGPFDAWASVTLTSGLSVSETYSDNVFFSATDPRSDLATLVVPGIALIFEEKDVTVTARYGLVGEYHHHEKDANGVTQSIGLDVDVPFLSKQSRRIDVRVRENMTYTTELPAFSAGDGDTDGPSNQGIQIPRTTTFRNSFGASVTYGWSSRVRTTLSYENVLTRYTEDILQDETVNSGDLEHSYQYSPRTEMALALGVSEQDYEESISVTSWDATASASHRLTPSVTVDGRVGGAIVEGNAPFAPRSRFVVFDFQGTRSLETTDMRLGYLRAIGSGGGLVASATLSDQLSAGATWRLSRTVSANIDLNWARNESTPGDALKIYTYAGSAGVAVALADWLGASASYSYLTQRAEGPAGPDGNRNLVMLTITAIGPAWRVIR